MDLKFKLLENLFGFFCLQNIFVCRRLFWSNFFVKNFFVENVVDFGKFLWMWKICLIRYFMKNFCDCGKFPWSNIFWKISLIKFFCGKFPWSTKIFLIVEKFFDEGNFCWLWKIYFLDCKYSRFNNFETIKAYILILDKKISLQ